MDTFQFADILILALIAGFIALRLRNTLGKDVGHRPDSAQLRRQLGKDLEEQVVSLQQVKEKLEQEQKPSKAEAEKLDALSAEQREQIEALKKHDPSFSYAEFIEGAKGAFEWVIQAFNEGDKSTLKQLLSKDLYQEFEEAMIDRMSSAARSDTTLVTIHGVELEDVEIKSPNARITLKFLSDQIHVVRNEEGDLISGDASEVTRVTDEWVFERPLKSRDPNWTIIDT